MNAYWKARAIALFVIGILCGASFWVDITAKAQMGKVAYLASQGASWDDDLSHPNHLWSYVIAAWIMLAGVAALYEVIVIVASRILALFGVTAERPKS
jgi:hypothetical protein